MPDGAHQSPSTRRRRWLRILAFMAAGLLASVSGLVVFVWVEGDPTFKFPHTGIESSADSAVIARGEDLFHGAMHCTACHSASWERVVRDKPIGKIEAIGGQEWVIPPIGTMRASNLSSHEVHGIGGRSDEHLAQILKHGVGEDGKVRVFMSMAVGTIPDEDIQAVISYLRTLPPSDQAVPNDDLNFGGRAMLAFGLFGPKSLPTPDFVPAGDEPSIERGEYLATGPAMCSTCHSPYDFFDDMTRKGPLFSGCFSAEPGKKNPSVEYCAPNLTPDSKFGQMVNWTEEDFLHRIAAGYVDSNSVMPWGNYDLMSDADKRSIFRYLRSLPPVARDCGPPMRVAGSWES